MARKKVQVLISEHRANLSKIRSGNTSTLTLLLETWKVVSEKIPIESEMHEENFEFIANLMDTTLVEACTIIGPAMFDNKSIKSWLSIKPFSSMVERACQVMRDESLSSIKKAVDSHNN